MRCLVCDHDDWQNVDEYRDLQKHDDKPVGMSMCKNCGFVSYPKKYKSKDQIKEYYRKQYRGAPPTFNNLVTGERKLQYHQHFLKEVFMKWHDNKTKPVIGEVGSAIGMALNMYVQLFPECSVHGTEWDVPSRMVAFHEFGVRLGEELPQQFKYDLIQTYKVAEHQLDVDLELSMYHSLLKDDGYLYISVPTWFEELCNFGTGGFDLEYYYHVDHINVWTKKLFESVLKKAGFQVIKYDGYMYGDTYLCKKTEPQALTSEDFEKPEEILEKLKRVKQAFVHFRKNEFEQAIGQWPRFPIAWSGLYEFTRKDLHQKHGGDGKAIIKDFVGRCEMALGDHSEVDRLRADLCMRYGMYDQAAEVIDRALQKKPNQAGTLMQLAHCFRQMAQSTPDPEKRLQWFMTARNICRQAAQVDKSAMMEAVNWSLVDSTNMPIDDTIEFLKKQAQQKPQEVENGKSL